MKVYEVDGPNGSAINVRKRIYDSDYSIYMDTFCLYPGNNLLIHVSNILQDGNSTVVSVASKKGFSSHNERFYEEYEYEKKLKKRKARLVTAAEDAFTHIRRMQEHQLGIHFDKIIEIQISLLNMYKNFPLI